MFETTHILYLHGFRSSPQSSKAQRLARHVANLNARGSSLTWACPQLPPSPRQAVQALSDLVADWHLHETVVVGSSLGGFYATVVAERFGFRAAVINPAVAPARDLASYIGQQTQFHDPTEAFYFRPEYVGELEALSPYPITHAERYWALIAQGDEVLDWREMLAHYQGAGIKLLDGSDHAVSDFETHLPDLLAFLGLQGVSGTIHDR